MNNLNLDGFDLTSTDATASTNSMSSSDFTVSTDYISKTDSTSSADLMTTIDSTASTDSMTTTVSTTSSDFNALTDSTDSIESPTTTILTTYMLSLTNVVRISPILNNEMYGCLGLDIYPDLVFEVATNSVSCFFKSKFIQLS